MPDLRLTHKDLLRQRREKPLVGRERERELFLQNFGRPDPEYLYFAIQGQPGVGKTYLLEHLQDLARQQGALTALTTRAEVTASRQTTIVRAMARLAQEMANYGAPLTEFSERLARYVACTQALTKDPSAPRGYLDPAGRPVSLLMVGAPSIDHLGDIRHGPITNTMAEVLDPIERADAWEAYLERAFEDQADRALITRPVSELTPLFVQDLNRCAHERPAVLCFDDWARSGQHLDGWLREVIQAEGLAKGVWLVLASESPLGDNWELNQPLIQRFSLHPFSPRECRTLLRWLGVGSRDLQDELITLTGGLPLLVSMMASVVKDDVPQHRGSLIERYLAAIDDPRLRGIILACAAARRLDEQLLADALEGQDTAASRAWFSKLPFVYRHPEYWSYHPEARHLFLRYARDHSTWDDRDVHVRLAVYHQDQLACNSGDLSTLSDAGRMHLLEALYHGLMTEQPKAVSHALEAYLCALRDDAALAPEVEATWSEAAAELGPANQVALWASRIAAAQAALAEPDWQGIEFFCSLLEVRPGLDESAQAIVHLLLGISRQANGRREESLAHYDCAIRLSPDGPGAGTLYYYRGRARYLMGDHGGAAQDISRALESRSSDDGASGLYGLRADAYAHLGSIQEALRDYDAAEALQPSAKFAAFLYNNRGAVQQRLVHLDLASSDLSRALDEAQSARAAAAILANRSLTWLWSEVVPRSIEDADRSLALRNAGDIAALAWLARGLAYLRSEDPNSAIAAWNRVLDLNPSAPIAAAAYNNRGCVRGQLEEKLQAISDLGCAVALAPGDTIPLLNRGLMRYGLGYPASAVDDLGRVVELAPADPEAYLARGNAMLALKRYASAVDDYHRCLQLEPAESLVASALYNRGQAHYAQRCYAEAVADLNHVLALKPRSASLYLIRGNACIQLKEYGEALRDFDRALELGLEEPEAHIGRGLAYAGLHEYWKAIAGYDDAIALSANTGSAARAHALRAECYASLQDNAAAVEDLSRAIQADTGELDLAGVFLKRGMALHALGELARAVEDYDQSLDLSSLPSIAEPIHHARGDARLELGDYGLAIQDYDLEVELAQRVALPASTLHNRGTACYLAGDHVRAQRDLDTALELGLTHKETVGALTTRGLIHAASGRSGIAVEDFTEALRIEGNSPSASAIYLNRGNAYSQLGEWRDAVRDYDRCIEHDATPDPAPLINRANAHAAMGLYRRAVEDYDAALQMTPADADLYGNRASAHFQLMEYESAVACFTKALELCGDSTKAAELQNGRGSAYAGLRDYAHAIADYDLALELEPDAHTASVLHTNRGYSYDKLQNHERAIEEFRDALDLDPGYAPAHYHMACACALLLNPSAAVASLERAVALDSALRERAATEADLQSISDTEGFRTLVAGGAVGSSGSPSDLQ